MVPVILGSAPTPPDKPDGIVHCPKARFKALPSACFVAPGLHGSQHYRPAQEHHCQITSGPTEAAITPRL